MLKVNRIELVDNQNRYYTIEQNQLEHFPLVGGEHANMITTGAWNQHGNTFINSFMESFDSELVFVLHVENLTDIEIEEKRREVTNMCNPLKGVVSMRVTLNTGTVYIRNVTFISAPIFPIGFENRNKIWQKVQLLFEANDPFWYSNNKVIETTLGVEPLFHFPFTTGVNNFKIIEDFKEKIEGSMIETPATFKYRSGYSLPSHPDDFTSEHVQSIYDRIEHLNQLESSLYVTTATAFPQRLFSFNVVTILERRYGLDIHDDYSTWEKRVDSVRNLITEITYAHHGYAESPTGNTITVARWNNDTQSFTSGLTYTGDTDTKKRAFFSTSIASNIDDNGFIHLLVYTDPANETVESRIYTDYVNIELDVTLANNTQPVYFGEVLPSTVIDNEGQAEAPLVLTIQGSCVNPVITNVTTGEFIKFNNLTMSEDDRLLIDTTFGEKKVELNDENVFHKLDFSSTFFNLTMGENEIDFKDDTGSSSALITLIYQFRYITI